MLERGLWVISGHLRAKGDVRFTPESGHSVRTADVRFVPKADITHFKFAYRAGFFLLFELCSVPLDLFHKGRSHSRNELNLIRGHGQKPLGRNDPAHKKCPYCPITEATSCKPPVPVRFCGHDVLPTQAGALPNSQSPTPDKAVPVIILCGVSSRMKGGNRRLRCPILLLIEPVMKNGG
jgi:hypothetical protein